MKTKCLLILVLAVTLSGCSAALRSKTFWAHTVAEAGISAADAETSLKCRPLCEEIAPLGKNPSRVQLYAAGAAFVTLRRLIIAAIWQKNETAGKFLSWMDFAGSMGAHGYLIHNNLRLADQNQHVCPAGYVAVPRPDGIRTCELPGVSIP